MRRTLVVGFWGACALVGVGCSDTKDSTAPSGAGGAGGSSGSHTSSKSSASTSGAGTGAGGSADAFACTTQPKTLALGGIWAARGELQVTLHGQPGGAVTTCPVDQEGASSLILLLDFTADASDATKLSNVQATLCSIELPTVTALVGDCSKNPTDLVTTQLQTPQAFLDALPDIATQPVMGTLSSAMPGASISLDRFTVTVGSKKPAPNMPTWNADAAACQDVSLGHQMQCDPNCVSDCASMVDVDGDGFPGATVDVCGFTADDMKNGVKCNATAPNMMGSILQGRGFLDIQVNPQFMGTATSSCVINGTVDTQVLYNLVGADVWLGGGSISVSSAIKSLPAFQVKAADSKFRMVRIDGKYSAPDWGATGSPKAACAALLKHQNEF